MKKILVPSDLADNCSSLLDFAAALATDISAKLVLLHITEFAVASPEMGLSAYTYADATKDALAALEAEAARLRATRPSLNVTCLSKMGSTDEEIWQHSEEQKVDLVMMSNDGFGSKFIQAIAGSHAVTAARKTRVPLLIVPPQMRYKQIRSCAFACADVTDLLSQPVFAESERVAAMIGAHLSVVHVEKDGVQANDEVLGIEVITLAAANVSQGLLEFLKSKPVDLLLFEPREHSFFHKLFVPTVTEQLAFNSPVPVMAIHAPQRDAPSR